MRKHTGFTLLEMSVIIVVIGITAGGILVAQTLIRSSHLNRVLSDYDTYTKGVNEFQLKYLAYPGDMNHAESMWGSDTACPNTVANTVAKIATCNGDGNGHIGDSTNAGVLSDSLEWFRAWQQLSNAGFIFDHFTGAQGTGGAAHAQPGVNVPKGSVSGTGWSIFYLDMSGASNGLWQDTYGHVIAFGYETASSYSSGAAISSAEALALDKKVDDGKPGTGIIRAWRTSVLPSCSTNDTSQTNQTYNTVESSKDCSLVFLLGF